MATKKSSPKKTATKTIIQKIGETASHLKDEIVSGKDHLVEVAGDAMHTIKTSIHKITHTGKAIKKAAKKSAKKAAKKSAPVKRAVKVAKKQ